MKYRTLLILALIISFSFDLVAQTNSTTRSGQSTNKSGGSVSLSKSPQVTENFQIVKEGVLSYEKEASNPDHLRPTSYALATLQGGNVMIAWGSGSDWFNFDGRVNVLSSEFKRLKSPAAYTKNDLLNSMPTMQETVVFANGNVLLVYFEKYVITKNNRGTRYLSLSTALFDKTGKLIRKPERVNFEPQWRDGLFELTAAPNPEGTKAVVVFNEKYVDRRITNNPIKIDAYYFVTDNVGKALHDPKLINQESDTLAQDLDLSTNPMGGVSLTYRTTDLFVKNIDPEGKNNWTTQLTYDQKKLEEVQVHALPNGNVRAMYISDEVPKNGGYNRKVVCTEVNRAGIIRAASPIGGLSADRLQKLDLKNGNQLVVALKTWNKMSYVADAVIINSAGKVMKGPFRFINEFPYFPDKFELAELDNGQIMVLYQNEVKSKTASPAYKVLK